MITHPEVSIYEKHESYYPPKCYLIKTTGDLILESLFDCYRWNIKDQSWQEESVSFLNEMIEAGVVFELQKPFRGFEDNPIPLPHIETNLLLYN